MNRVKQNLFFAILLILVLYVVGNVFYHYVEGWSPLDALYFQTATFTTVGYGDVVPKTDAGKMFTIFLSWVGISTGFYLIYTISRYREEIIDANIKKRLGSTFGKAKARKPAGGRMMRPFERG